MNRARALSAWILSLALCAAGCSMKADVAKAGAQVSHFHAQLDGQDYSTIYKEADPRLREASKQPCNWR